MNLKDYIRDVPDFPKPGIIFKDITPVLQNPGAFKAALSELKKFVKQKNVQKICGIESRGFIFGAALADELGLGFIPIRKKGKLPYKTISQEYQLEYGTDAVEIHVDAVEKGERVFIIDDLLATGGTAKAVCQLLEKVEAKIEGLAFLIDLAFLNGRKALDGYQVDAILTYD